MKKLEKRGELKKFGDVRRCKETENMVWVPLKDVEFGNESGGCFCSREKNTLIPISTPCSPTFFY
jgi:hypothetical protein